MVERVELDALIREAIARGPMSPEEIFEQRVSFVYRQLMDCNPEITKAEVRERLRGLTPKERNEEDWKMEKL
jgi:hypothetical protein